jgi:pimeloyl-ACP methyl ester carboxylesterase
VSRLNEAAYRASETALASAFGVEAVEHSVHLPGLGASIRVLEIGSGDPVVFIHGSPNNAATWIPLAAELPDRRCLLLERPGAGLSEPLPGWTDHRVQSAAIVAAVADHFGIAEAHLAGSSFGGLYAYNFALAHPARVPSLIQLGSPAGPALLGMPAIFRFLSLPLPRFLSKRALRPDAEEAEKMFRQIGHAAAIDKEAIPDVVFEWYSSLLCNTDTAAHLLGEIRAIASPLGYRAGAKLDEDALGSLRPPLLYLWGDEDGFSGPDRADSLAALTPGATIEHFPSFGHVLWYDDPARIAERIRAFTSDGSPGS